AGYDPDMLVTVLVWAYAQGVRSSRRMEELCRTDVAFRLICAGNLPDHSTIARFRKDFGGAVAGFFTEVLILCARLGMGRLGTVALDGTKVAASASKAANRGEGKLRRMRPKMSCMARAGGGMRCRRRRGRRAAGPAGSPGRWPSWRPGAGPRRRSGTRRRRSSGRGGRPGSGPGRRRRVRR